METNTLSKCKKFQANIFNKSKCQNCFRVKEHHSAEALESSKVLRKVSKCGYLFVAPDSFDFANPMDRTRRWQRRFFVLYDDGELTYSVDENVGTVPQGIIDMNKCNDVHDAETTTSHSLAIAVRTPDKTTFIKGSDKHEIERWFDVLAMYPRSLKTKHRRSPTYPTPGRQPSPAGAAPAQPAPAPDPPPATRRPLSTPLPPGVSLPARTGIAAPSQLPPRRHTFTHPPTWTPDDEDDDDDIEGLISLGDPPDSVFRSSELTPAGGASEPELEVDAAGSLMRSRSDPRMADNSSSGAAQPLQRAAVENVPSTYRSVRSMKHRDRAYQEGMRKSNSMHDLSRTDADAASSDPAPLYRSRSRDALYASPNQTRSPVSDPYSSTSFSASAPTSPAATKPKTFFESLHESLTNPEPPRPKAKNDRYKRLASIPNTRTIDNFTPDPSGQSSPELSPRRSKSLDRPQNTHRRPTSPSPVAAERAPLRSQSSPRVRPAPNPAARPSEARSHIQHLREKFLRLAADSTVVPPTPYDGSRRRSRSSPRPSDMSGSNEMDAARRAVSSSQPAVAPQSFSTSVSALRQQWNNHDDGHANQDGDPHRNGHSATSRPGRSSVRRLQTTPTSNHINLSSSSSSSSQHAPSVTSNTHAQQSKFVVRLPPPYRTASLSTAPSYSLSRAPLVVQDPVSSRSAPRSVSAPAPLRTKVTTEPLRSPGRSLDAYSSRDPVTPAYIVNGRTKNETDEHKMAKSGELAARMGHHLADTTSKQRHDPYDDLIYMKKGWLLKQHQDQDWSKHWFVLSGSSLRFYKDSRAEETNDEDGCIDIGSCYEICETEVTRNYGFKLKTSQGDHILSAMTSGIRSNWMQAVQKCMETSGHSTRLDYSQSQHLDYSPASSTRTSSFSSPSRSSSRHSDYVSPQRDAPRRHTVNVTPSTSSVTPPLSSRVQYGAAEAAASPRSDRGDTNWNRPSRARRSLDTYAGAGDGQKMSSIGMQRPTATAPPPPPVVGTAARFVSCTWPYDSSSSGASGSEREHTPDSSSHGSRSRRNSNVSQYLEDEEGDRSRERTVEEEQALDEVEHNIRRIHRRSLSDHSARHKPPHFDKFESGTAFDGEPTSPGRSSSASTPRRRPPDDRASPRAPSAKIKEKTRARSPRPRSPPPLEVKANEMPLEDVAAQQDEEDGAPPASPAPLTAGVEGAVQSGGREDALVDLLETEVESLKNQLERTRSELTDTKHENHTLKLQLRSTHRDKDDLISDLEIDKTRYLTQIEDIQDQMEHTTDFLQQKLVEQEAKMAEQDSHADLTKLQVQTLKKQLKEAKESMEAHEAQLKSLQAKLNSDSTAQTLREVSMQREHLEKMCEDLELKLKALEEEVERLESELCRKTQQLNQREERLQDVQEALEHSEQHIVDLEHDLEELHALRSELKIREDKMADIEEELSAARSQLSEQDQELAVKDDLHQAEKHQLESNYALQRSKLEDHLQQLEQELDRTRRQSTMSDSLNSNMADILREKDETIAQLEEKLIENDSKIEELTDEMAMEIEENTQLQQNLEASYNETARGKREIEQLNKEIARLEKVLEEAREEVDDLKDAERAQREEIEHSRQEQLRMKEQVDALQRENSELRHALEELKQADVDTCHIADLTKECEEQRSQNDAFKEECAKLEREMLEANEKVSRYEAELADMKRQHEEDLEQRCQELVEAQQLTSNLQTQLLSAEATANDNKQLLDDSMAAVQPFAKPSDDESQAKQQEEDLEDMKVKYDRSMQEVKRLRNELREAHISIDDMEISATSVKQQVKAMEGDYQQQLALMSSRVQDLTAKLAAADKKVRKLERRASRRESKLKLRRDSIESGDKNSGSSGEAEQERESDIRAPDAEVLAILKAVVSPDVEPEEMQSLSVPALNTSTNSSNGKLEDSINTEVSESDYLPDPELTARCAQLQDRLSHSESKVKELSKALDLSTPEGQNKELVIVQEQNKKYEEQIIFLTAKLNKTSASASVEAARAKRAAGKDDQVEKVTMEQVQQVSSVPSESEPNNQTQATLEEMQQKLAMVVQELGSADASTSTTDYTNTISGLRSRLETILAEISTSQRDIKVPSKSPAVMHGPRVRIEDPVRMFAEKLSLEAVLVGEMAHLIRTGQDHMMSEREVYLHEIAEANHRILELEQKVESLQNESSPDGTSGSNQTADPLTRCSGLLAEKMVLQSHIQTLMERYKEQENIQATRGKESGEETAISMGQEALFKSQLTQRLQGHNPVTLSSRVLVHGEVTFILNKLRERMADSRTDQERIDLLDHELELSHQRLCERANLMCDGVEAFKMTAMDKVAATIVNNKASKEEVDKQIDAMIKKCAAEYRKSSVDAERLGVMTESIPESRRHSMIENSIQQEVEEAVETLLERCEGGPVGESVGGEEELERVLSSVCEVLAQKAVIDGHIAYITEQIQQHQQQAPAEARAPNPLRRHDSGIIVGGSSMPTSPTAEEASPASSTDGDITNLSVRLSREAAAKRQLALSLQRKEGSPDSIQTQMAKIAADLVNVDVDLIRHRRLISDYAEVIAQEAMFQAQMTYLTEQLRMQHEQQISQLQRQLDSRSPGASAADEEQIQALEAEILRLSTLLANNDELLQREAANAQQRMEHMEDELQRQEDFFQNEVSSLDERFKNRLHETEEDLQDARDELDKVRIASQEDEKRYAERINTLEQDLQKAQSEQKSRKGSSSSDMSKKAREAEEHLVAIQREMKKAGEKHRQEMEVYSTKVSQLEAQIVSLSEVHAKEMLLAKENLKALANSPDTTTLEEQVTDLHKRLKEERALHQQQLETLRVEMLSGIEKDAETGGEAGMVARVRQLEWQIEAMQADYEQELAVQRAAHRRELTRSKEDLLGLLAQAEAKSMQIDETTIRKRYTKEIEHIKQIYDSGFASMEKSHQRVLREMRAVHKRELETLRTEKDQLLIEETKATQAALDAMRKAHEAEVQKERNKFLDAISKTYSNNDVDSIQRQHEDDLEMIQNDIRQLSEQLSIKCLENAALDERLAVQTNALAESRSRAHELMARNEELSLRLRQDIERLSKMIKQPTAPGSPYRRQGEPPEVYELRVALRLKDADKQQLADEIEGLRKQLHGTTEELEDSMERCQELHADQTRMRTNYEGQLQEMRQRLDEVMDEPETGSSDGAQSERDRASGDSPDSAAHEDTPYPRDDDDASSQVASPRPVGLPGRVLPQVSNEARNVKRLLWRQRHGQRAHSTPGPASLIRRLSLPVEQTEASSYSPRDDASTDSRNGSPRASPRAGRKERSGRHTTVGINVASLMFQEKL